MVHPGVLHGTHRRALMSSLRDSDSDGQHRDKEVKRQDGGLVRPHRVALTLTLILCRADLRAVLHRRAEL